RQPAAGAARQGQLAVGYLGRAALAPQLPGRLDQQEDAAHAGVTRAETAAVGVERQLVAERQRAALHEPPALALGAEPEVPAHQPSLCSGSAIMRELTTSSTVMGSRYRAWGFNAACPRTATAISASCSGVVPNSCMCRRAAMAYAPMSTLP